MKHGKGLIIYEDGEYYVNFTINISKESFSLIKF